MRGLKRQYDEANPPRVPLTYPLVLVGSAKTIDSLMGDPREKLALKAAQLEFAYGISLRLGEFLRLWCGGAEVL